MDVNEKVQKARGNLHTSPQAHSSWLVCNGDGVVLDQAISSICYLNLKEFMKNEEDDSTRTFIFFGNRLWETIPHIGDWVHWVVNHPIFGQAFITKDVQEGKELGFEIDVTQDYVDVMAGISLLRWHFERPKKSFGHFLGMGYEPYKAYALSANFNVVKNGEDFLLEKANEENPWHVTIQMGMPLRFYDGGAYNKDESLHTPFRGGNRNNRYSVKDTYCDGVDSDDGLFQKLTDEGLLEVVIDKVKDEVWGLTLESVRVPCTKKNVDKILEKMETM